jgi:hypothetical protein
MTGRLLRGMAAAGLLVALSIGEVSAGGWATIVADSGNPSQPSVGEPFTFGFTVLQHGVTPAGWVGATYVAIDATTGDRIEAKATGKGADGHFVASVTLPHAGTWTWQVQLAELIVDTPPAAFAVASADGIVPAMDAAAVLAAIDRTRSELRTELQAQTSAATETFQVEINRLSSQVAGLQADRARLSAQLDAQLEAAATPLGPEGVPVLGVVALAVLAGAVSGFAMSVLGRQSGPTAIRPTAGPPEVASSGGPLAAR